MNECEIAPGEFVEATEDAAEVLHLAEQAFDPRPLFIEAPIGLACRGAGRMGWDDRRGFLLGDPGEDGVAVPASDVGARSASTASTVLIETVPSRGMASGASPAWPAVRVNRSGLPRPSARPCSLLENPPRERPRL